MKNIEYLFNVEGLARDAIPALGLNAKMSK